MKLIYCTALFGVLGLVGCQTAQKTNLPERQEQHIYHAPAQIFDFDLSSSVLRGKLQLQQSCNANGTSLDIRDQKQQQVRIDTFNLNNNLLFSGVVLGTTTVDESGQWSFNTSEPLKEGTQSISYAKEGLSSAHSIISPIMQFQVDKNAEAIYRQNTQQWVAIPDGGSTRAATATIRGKGVPGETITIFNQSTIDESLKNLSTNLLTLYAQKYQTSPAQDIQIIQTPQGDAAIARLSNEQYNLDMMIQSRYGYAYVILLNSALVTEQEKALQQLKLLAKSLHTPGQKHTDEKSHTPLRFDLNSQDAHARTQWQKNYCS